LPNTHLIANTAINLKDITTGIVAFACGVGNSDSSSNSETNPDEAGNHYPALVWGVSVVK